MGNFKTPIIQILIISFLIRIIISLLPAFEIDQNDWRLWGIRMAETGPSNFYSKDTFTDYTPGFLYFLWFAGIVKTTLLSSLPYNSLFYDLLLKLPANIADLLTGLIIYKLLEKFGQKKAILAFLLYVFNPAIFFNSAIWGQFDGISTLLILLATYLLLHKKSPELSVGLIAFALATKPQAIFFVPAFGILFLLKTKPQRWLSSGLIFITTYILIFLPFVSGNLQRIIQINTGVGNVFNCTTCFAFNFWGILGNWQADTLFFLSIPYYLLGIILTSISLAMVLFLKPFKLKYDNPYVYLTISLSIISCCTFLTRMHERYIFPFFCFFLIAAFLLKSRKLIYFYILFSVISVINLYLPYGYYNWVYTNKLAVFNPPFVNQIMDNFKLLSGIFFASFIGLVLYSWKLMLKKS